MKKIPTVLTIDDEAIVTTSLQKIIETELNWTTLVSNKPLEALEILKKNKSLFGFGKNKIDCIVVDFKMPVLNGFEFVEKWRAIEGVNEIPIVLLTAYEDEKKWREAAQNSKLNISAYIKKPICKSELTQLLERLVVNKDEFSVKRELQDSSYDKVHEIKNKKEYKEAQDMQRSMIPTFDPKIKDVNISSLFKTAQFVGGDYFDYFPLSDTKIAVVVVDIVGKGIPGCMLMMRLRELLHGFIEPDLDILSLITRLNKVLSDDDTFTRYAPLFFGVLDSSTGEFNYINAIGNAGGMLVTKDNEIQFLDVGGFMLGADATETYEVGHLTLKDGDRVLMFTDGIVEQTNTSGEQFGMARLESVIKAYSSESGDSLVDFLYRELKEFMAGTEHDDDTTIIDICLNRA